MDGSGVCEGHSRHRKLVQRWKPVTSSSAWRMWLVYKPNCTVPKYSGVRGYVKIVNTEKKKKRMKFLCYIREFTLTPKAMGRHWKALRKEMTWTELLVIKTALASDWWNNQCLAKQIHLANTTKNLLYAKQDWKPDDHLRSNWNILAYKPWQWQC